MFYRGKYVDVGDGREPGLKRQRVIEQPSSYYTTPPPSTYLYPPPPTYPYAPTPHPHTFPLVKLRGLPFDCSESDISDFLHGLDIVDILFIHKHNKFAGEAYCLLGYPFQVEYALQRNHQNIGRRYVEVFRSKKEDYYKAISNEVDGSHGTRGGGGGRSRSPRRGGNGGGARVGRGDNRDRDRDSNVEHTGVVRLRGLPFSANREDVLEFFKDFELVEDSVYFTVNLEGRATGEAFVKFGSCEEAKGAMVMDGECLGSRYIELFPSTVEDWEDAAERGRANVPKPCEEDTRVLRMRGLPFSAGKDDIIDFFKEFRLSEDLIHMTYNSEGRPTGEALVEFSNVDDSKAALAKDRMTLGSRYIELFMSSPDELKDAISRGR
ncbi:uncharacterized protein LOC111877496 [Lactuca sativa]|uniref:RRM domain-containing protein n=1 Tax=Lactuca sativa TaxID=4236 RepID=A0A9R1X682_LACSA|nr:uncharacterized protein LOC111877496 [Lactuca sativa]KAJ0202315.1 hypothetical protein LSAT_V11C600316730 [Lactuca sativa]